MVPPIKGSDLIWQEESVINRYRAGLLAVASALAVSALVASPAMASTPPNIDSGTTGVTDCLKLGTVANNNQPYFCMWYSPNYANAVWGPQILVQDPITANFSGTGTGGGQAVRNNAASMANPTALCNLTTWTGANYTGLDNWLDPDNAGNLTDTSTDMVRNHDYIVSLNTSPGC